MYNSNQLANYIQTFTQAIRTKDCEKFKLCITLNPGKEEAEIRSKFNEPNEIDLYDIKDDKERFKPIISNHLKVIKSVYITKSLDATFQNLNELILNLIRASELESNWIMPALISSFNELIQVYKVQEVREPEDLDSIMESDMDFVGGNQTIKKSNLETLINTLRKGFNLSFNDKNIDFSKSKRNDIYFFLGYLMKYCFKMRKNEFAKSMLKVVKGAQQPLPNIKQSKSIEVKKYGIIYLYYQSLILLDDQKYLESENLLKEALDVIYLNYKVKKCKQIQQIYLIYLPLRLYNHGKLPSKQVYKNYPILRILYHDNIFKAIKQGNLNNFDNVVYKFRNILLKHHLYILTESLKQYIYLKLIKKVFQFTNELEPPPDNKKSFSGFQLAIELSSLNEEQIKKIDFSNHNYNIDTNEVECILANLITKDRIRAYMSHSQKSIVFSKKIPFPAFG
ncbi:unnamed protein product [Candida verbasci]|uniref:PCI domain-containing protein n=1 Tax=Candida verbasci TaxID=1227364 RepID=A0A9W4TYP6_9ASCO|nr:unnamed protein product [Candida verbasci]